MSFIEIYSQVLNKLILNKLPEAYEHLLNAKPLILDDTQKRQYYKMVLNISAKINNKTSAAEACDDLVLSDLDWGAKNDYINMLSGYITPLQWKKKLHLTTITPQSYHISSPSIVQTDVGHYRCNLRAVNYVYNNQHGSYPVRDADGIVRTRNYVVGLDNQFDLSNMWEIEELEIDDFQIYPCHVMGMEDVRLFGEKWFLCTRLDATTDHHPKMCLGTYDNQMLLDLKILDYNQMGTEKNWLPLYDSASSSSSASSSFSTSTSSAKIIYSFEPLKIFDLDLETGEMTPFIEKKLDANKNFSAFRGSAVPIKYKGGWLMTVHQVYYHQLRKYLHRFVWLSGDFNTYKLSRCFYFDKVGVEFNLGIAEHPDGLIMTYSVDDNHATLGMIDYDYLDALLD